MIENSVEKIRGWLKRHGSDYNGDGSALSFSCKDEPYETFDAEWQNWGSHEKLLVGYYMESNGDLCPDPIINITIKEGEIAQVIVETLLGALPATEKADLEYASGLLALVYLRHMKNRVVQKSEETEISFTLEPNAK